MAKQSALSAASLQDFLASARLQLGSVRFKDANKSSIEISLDFEKGTQFDMLSESGEFYQLSPERLAEKWSDIKDGFNPRTSINFVDSRGNARSLLLRANSVRLDGESLIFTGDTIADPRVGARIGFDEIVGEDTILKSIDFVNNSEPVETISDIDFSFDTFSIKEFRRRFDRYYDEQLDSLVLSKKVDSKALISTDRQSLRGGTSIPDVPLTFNKDFLFPGSQVGVNTRLEGKPVAEISYYTPDFGHDILDAKAWGLDVTFGFDLSGSIALLTGMQNGSAARLKGAVPLNDIYNKGVIPFIDHLRIGPDLMFDMSYNLKGVPSEYRYSARFNPRATLNLNAGGKPEFRGSGAPLLQSASVDPITGVSIDATVTPGFAIQYNMDIKIPLVDKKISSSLKGSISSPTSFSLESTSGSRPSSSVSSNAFISFDGTLFEGMPFMSRLDSYRGDIYTKTFAL